MSLDPSQSTKTADQTDSAPFLHGIDRAGVIKGFVAVLCVLVIDNVLTNRVVGPNWYVPVRLLTVALMLAISLRFLRLTWGELGLGKPAAVRGLVAGAGLFAVIGGAVAVSLTIPTTRELFEDRRVEELGTNRLLYEVLIRIPLGTVLAEELAFRGVIYAVVRRHRGNMAAIVVSSVLFGLWHVLPAAGLGDVNPTASDTLGEQSAWVSVAFGVGATTIAGVALASLRRWTDSLYTPLLVHLATNTTGYVAAWWVLREAA